MKWNAKLIDIDIKWKHKKNNKVIVVVREHQLGLGITTTYMEVALDE